MVKFSILKLIDEAVLPAFLVVVTKVVTFFILMITLGEKLSFPNDLLSPLQVVPTWLSSPNLILANSVGNLFTMLLIVLCFGWVVIKAHHFHASHISPRFHAKLVRNGWEHLVEESFEIYHQAVVWLSLTWLFFFYVLVNTLLGFSLWWQPLIGAAVVIGLTMLLLEDILIEAKLLRTQNRHVD